MTFPDFSLSFFAVFHQKPGSLDFPTAGFMFSDPMSERKGILRVAMTSQSGCQLLHQHEFVLHLLVQSDGLPEDFRDVGFKLFSYR